MSKNSIEKLLTLSNDLITFSEEAKPSIYKNVFTPFFTWRDFENTINLRPLMTTDRLKLTKCDTKKYGWKVDGWKWILNPNTVPPSLLQALIHKHHGHLADCSKINESVNAFCEVLEKAFHGPAAVDANIYFDLTETLTDGFEIHFDHPANFIVQMEGKTKFEVWDNKKYLCKNTPLLNLPGDPIINVILEPGDAIFIPRLTYHRAKSLTKRLSVNFSIAKQEWTETSNFLLTDRHWIKLEV